jgi:hypothetical protein
VTKAAGVDVEDGCTMADAPLEPDRYALVGGFRETRTSDSRSPRAGTGGPWAPWGVSRARVAKIPWPDGREPPLTQGSPGARQSRSSWSTSARLSFSVTSFSTATAPQPSNVGERGSCACGMAERVTTSGSSRPRPRAAPRGCRSAAARRQGACGSGCPPSSRVPRALLATSQSAAGRQPREPDIAACDGRRSSPAAASPHFAQRV